MILIFGVFVFESYAQISAGKVKGLILDQINARIAKGKISIEGKRFKKIFIANDAGEYNFELPIGNYKISAKMDGFYQSNRKNLRVKLNKTIKLNFTLIGIGNDIDHP